MTTTLSQRLAEVVGPLGAPIKTKAAAARLCCAICVAGIDPESISMEDLNDGRVKITFGDSRCGGEAVVE